MDRSAPPPRRPDPREAPPAAAALPVALFALVAMLPWLGALDGPFLFDDQSLIRDNPRVHGFAQARSWFTEDFWAHGTEYAERAAHVAYWRPLVLASYALDWTLGGGSPLAFHLTNALLHAAAAALALVLCRRWFGGAWWPALIAAGVFALHPTRAESVAWIAGRPDLLLTLGCLLAVLGAARRREGRGGLGLEALGTLLAYGSKEQAVALPLLLAFDALMTPGALAPRDDGGPLAVVRDDARARAARLLRSIAPQLALAAAYVVARRAFIPLHPVSFEHLTGTVRAALFFESLGRYAELMVFPHDLAVLRAEVPPPGAERPFLVGYRALGVGVAAAGLGALAAGALRRRRWALPLALLGGLLLPVSNLIPMATVSLVAPRLLYLPALAVGCALGVAVAARPALRAIGLGLILLGAGFGAARAADYGSEERFWGAELRANPRSPVVLPQQARLDGAAGRPTLALRRLACGLQADREHDRSAGAGRYLLAAVRLGALATPDVDTASLRRLELALGALIAGRPTRFTVRGVELRFDATPAELASLPAVAASLRAERATLLGRLGDTEAVAAAEQAVGACPRCRDVVLTAAAAALTAGRADLAVGWAERAGAAGQPWTGGGSFAEHVARTEALRERAAREPALAPALLLERDLMLGAWGAGLARLSAHPELLTTRDLGVLVRRAGVLARAGRPDQARAALATALTPDELGAVMQGYQLPFPEAPEPALPEFVAGACVLPAER